MLRLGFATLFPAVVRAALGESIPARAAAAGLARFDFANPRDFATDRHGTVDDSPFGGAPGMLLKAELMAAAVESLAPSPSAVYIQPEPAAPPFRQRDANELAQRGEVIFLCGHYEGIDARVAEWFEARLYSVGDFVASGGELPAAMMADAIVRRLPGALGNAASLEADSFADGLLSAPNFTRPETWRGLRVPEVLRGGHHAQIARWRRRAALELTRRLRPDLLALAELDAEDRRLLRELEEADDAGPAA